MNYDLRAKDLADAAKIADDKLCVAEAFVRFRSGTEASASGGMSDGCLESYIHCLIWLAAMRLDAEFWQPAYLAKDPRSHSCGPTRRVAGSLVSTFKKGIKVLRSSP